MKLSFASLGAEPARASWTRSSSPSGSVSTASFTTTRSGRARCFRAWVPPRSARRTIGLGHQRGRSLHAARALLAQATADARGAGTGALPRHHGVGQPFRDVARLRQPQTGGGITRGGRVDAAVVARREGHHRRRGGEIQERLARLEAHRDPAALYRQPRAADPPARRRRRRRRAGRQLRHPARDRLRQGAHPAGAGSVQARLARHPALLLDLSLRCSSARTIRCRRASSAG